MFLVLLSYALLFSACKKDPSSTTQRTPVTASPAQPVVQSGPDTSGSKLGQVRLEFYNQVDGDALVFGKKYLNAHGDTFTVKKFQYYISNVQFLKQDTLVSEKESYHLVDHAVATRTAFVVTPLETGTYTTMRLTIGIDSTRNCSGVQSGDLDPLKNMFWTWNSGYIFLKLEGSSPSSDQNNSIVFHIGGYAGWNKAQRQLTFKLPNALIVRENSSPVIRCVVNVNEIFKTPNTIDFKTQNYQMTPGASAKMLADNYQDMISIGSVQN